MQLSQAIRLGAMMKPQGYGQILYGGTSCAIGAAMDAVGKLHNTVEAWTELHKRFPILNAYYTAPKEWSLAGNRFTLTSLIIYLNDRMRWTREEIADWVETIEKAQPEVVAVETETLQAI